MSLAALIDFLRDRLRAVVAVAYIVLAGLVIADAARLLIGHGADGAPDAAHAAGPAAEQAHGVGATAYHVAETVPGFWAAFGLLGCLVLVLVSKTYGHAAVSRREDYYHG